MRATCAAWILSLVWLAAGCGDDDAPIMPECTTTADCPGRRCVDGMCTSLPDAGACVDSDCNDGNPCNGIERCGLMRCMAGALAADGTACDADRNPATSDVCTGGLCAPARCGDGFLDVPGGEECDDSNDRAGDGCDDCRFSCTAAATCDDGEICNGAETCDTAMHVCRPGRAVADGTDCAGSVGSCQAGRCVPRTCSAPAECDDADACTGVEACTAMACMAEAPLDCDDGIACTTDSCTPATGCLHMLVDADRDGHSPSTLGTCGDDCDDSNPVVYGGSPDACDGLDNDCDRMVDEDEATLWFADCDGDNFAPTGGTSITACARPAATLTGCPMGTGAWVTRVPMGAANVDCNDANATVFPTQTMFQTTGIAGAAPAVDFDYDCNATEEQSIVAVGTCRRIFTTLCAPMTVGWVGAVPECGAMGTFLSACAYAGGTCVPMGTPRVQSCR